MSERVCRVCGCTERNACIDPETMLPCAWIDFGDARGRGDLCTACAGAADHIVSMTIDWKAEPEDVGTCRCGWSHRTPRASIGPGRFRLNSIAGRMAEIAAMDAAIKAHWMDAAGRAA